MMPCGFPRYPPLRFQRGDNVCRAPLARCAAEAFWVEDIIDPADTRARLSEFADLAERCARRDLRPSVCGRTAQGLEGA